MNEQGNVTDRYTYDAWGKLVDHDAYTGSVDQPYRYVGKLGYYTHHQDPNMDLLQLGVRFYDPETGRFTQKDSLSNASMSAYSYAFDLPVVLVDPSGLWPGFRPVPIPRPNLCTGGFPACLALATWMTFPTIKPPCAMFSGWGSQQIINCQLCCMELERYVGGYKTKIGGRTWATSCTAACSSPFIPWDMLPMQKVWHWW